MAVAVVAGRQQHLELAPRGGRGRAAGGEHGVPARRGCGRRRRGVTPITCPASTEAEAWPRAQAFTSWPKAATRPSARTRSTVTVEPQSGERLRAVTWGIGQALGQRDGGGEREDALGVELDQFVVAADARASFFAFVAPPHR